MKKVVFRYLDAIYKRVLCVNNFEFNSKPFIAMFHDLSEETADFTISSSVFISAIRYFERGGFEIVSMDSFLNQYSEKKMVITFDDGFSSTYFIAKDFLIPNNIPFTIFVTTSFIDKDGYLTKGQIIELAKNKMCTIGLHADKHLMYRYEKKTSLMSDYKNCKNKMDNILGVIDNYYYAFPYGSFFAVSSQNCRLIKKNGG